MPHTTQAYPFEWKVLQFAERLSGRCSGTQRACASFVLELDAHGTTRAMHDQCPDGSWGALTARLDQHGTPYLFYDAFDPSEYRWLSRRRIGRATMERLTGAHFEDADFARQPDPSSRAQALKPPCEFPSDWGVMF